MLRTLGRIASILLVTGIIAGGLSLLVPAGQTNGAWRDDGAGGRPAEGAARDLRGGPTAARESERGEDRTRQFAREGREQRGRGRGGARMRSYGSDGQDGAAGFDSRRDGHEGRGGHGEFSLGRGSAGLLVTSLQIGVVAAIVAGLQRYVRRRRQIPSDAARPA